MKAQTLEQAIGYFNHREPLHGQYLDFWYVERPDTPRPAMDKFLRARRDPVKLLLIGPRGGGKSTELNKLLDALQDRYHTFNLSVSDLVGGVDVNYVDVMRLVASRVIRAAITDDLLPLPLNQAFQDRLEPFYNW